MKKEYVKPSITVVELEMESLLAAFSQIGPEGEGVDKDNVETENEGVAGSKHNSGNLWGAWDE